MFTTKRNKQGDIIVSIDFRGSVKGFLKAFLSRLFLLNHLFVFFNSIGAAVGTKIALLAVAGVGLGFGFTVSLFSGVKPVSANLSPLQAKNYDVHSTVKQLTVINSGLTYQVEQTERFADFYLWPSDQLVAPIATTPQQAGVTILFAGNLQQLTRERQDFYLGDKLEVTRSNNGLYVYQIISIKTFTRQTLKDLYLQPAGTLALVFPSTATQSEFLVVLAR